MLELQDSILAFKVLEQGRGPHEPATEVRKDKTNRYGLDRVVLLVPLQILSKFMPSFAETEQRDHALYGLII